MANELLNFRPPVLVGERVIWLGSGSGEPQTCTVRWIGRVPEITAGWTIGIELDSPLPVGGIDGTWRKRSLFSCKPKHGLLVPIDKIMKASQSISRKNSMGDKFYNSETQHISQLLNRKSSYPEATTRQEFLSRLLPPPSEGKTKPGNEPTDVLRFKTAVNFIQNATSEESTILHHPNIAPLTEANVKSLSSCQEGPTKLTAQSIREQTLNELAQFKKHLDELEKLKNFEYGSKNRRKKIGTNPESLYSLAETNTDTERDLFMQLIGSGAERIEPPKRSKNAVKSISDNDPSLAEVPKSLKVEKTESIVENSKPIQEKSTKFIIKEATESIVVDIPLTSTELINENTVLELFATENLTEEICTEVASLVPSVHYDFLEEDTQSVGAARPTPTLRKKREPRPPVPCPRRRVSDVFTAMPPSPSASYSMVGLSGTFRRIEEDEIEQRGFNGHHPTRRILTASVSAPGGSRKGLFSFLKWFKKSKPPNYLDLESFNAPSVASSPLFPRSRLANAESVDTLYSIATVSSFAFVPGAQYQGSQVCPDRKKKRRAPPPPLPCRDTSLPNTLENRGKQQHRRSVSESYKDKRSGAFAHVHGKRKAPAPPNGSCRDRLYPSLSSVKNGTLLRRKKPAPQPPVSVLETKNNENTGSAPDLPLGSQISNSISTSSSVTVQQEPAPAPVDLVTPSREDNAVCNDTLRLECGLLKPNKVLSPSPVPPDVSKVVPHSPVSPRPWYKRKSLEKRKEKIGADWISETAVSKSFNGEGSSPLKFPFHSIFKGEEKKKDEKRKSGISLLANISELDREAAEICRREQAHREQKLAEDEAKFYGGAAASTVQEVDETEVPSRNSTRELISLFNSIGSSTKASRKPGGSASVTGKPQLEKHLPTANEEGYEIKTASILQTKGFLSNSESSETSTAIKDSANKPHSPSDTISTIAEISEPSSSAATLNQYAEPIWTCTRCTLENQQWKSRCDACSACKPNYKAFNMSNRRKSEMEFDIDWEEELKKYFPIKKSSSKENNELSAKLTLSKEGDVVIQTETKQNLDSKESPGTKEADLNEVRKKRLDFFMKSLGVENVMSVRDAAAKKSLDEAEKLKLKGMLKEMKDSLPKYEGVKNKDTSRNSNNTGQGRQPLPDVTGTNDSIAAAASQTQQSQDDAIKYGAIKKIRPAEALLVTTTTVFEDIKVRKKSEKEPVVPVSVGNFSTVGLKNGVPSTSIKKARRIGDGPFELMRARDLANIIESKTGSSYPAHVYANYPVLKESDESRSRTQSDVSEDGSRELARLASQLTRASGLEKFKAGLDPSSSDTLAVNRLLRRLEGAIAAGRHDQAATLARELAGLKVNCSVVRQKPSPCPSPTCITVEMYVEDKVTHQGPIPLKLHPTMTLSDLKLKVQTDFQIPCHVQRWILGKQLATEEYKSLRELGVTMDQCPIFLYLVAPEPDSDNKQVQANESISETTSSIDGEETKNRMGKGWYYNYEEDRYSFCESDSESPEREAAGTAGTLMDASDAFDKTARNEMAAAVRVIQRTIESARAKSTSPQQTLGEVLTEKVLKIEEPVLQEPTTSKLFLPKNRPPLSSSVSLPERTINNNDSGEVAKIKPEPTPRKTIEAVKKKSPVKENDPGSSKAQSMPPEKKIESAGSSRPRSRSIFDLIKPQSNDTLKKDLKVISVNAVKETIEKLNRRAEDVKKDGWKCAVCTLVNAATRPGCSACTAPRPPEYAPPAPSPAEDELRRLRRDQAALDLPVFEESQSKSENMHYLQLMNLDNMTGLVFNSEPFECPICFLEQAVGEGVVLRECLHTFCKACLAQTIEFNDEAEVKCPYRDANYSCESVLLQREIKALVPQHIFEQHLARGVAQAENRIGNAFHCKTADCGGWCVLDDNVNQFQCPVCRHVNCLTCQAIHEGLDCRAYQDKLNSSSDTNAEAKRTRTMLEEMVQKGDAMACPTCQVVLMKKWGCDWLRCSMCKTEICWVTRGPRWGPAGKGDTSAGCQCGVNGVKCHPKCNYCH